MTSSSYAVIWFKIYSPKRWLRYTLLCNLAPAASMASTSSTVKSGTFSASKNSCIRDTFDVVLQFDRSSKHEWWKREAFLRNNDCVLGQDPLGQYLSDRDWVTTSLFESLTNGGKNGIEGTILNAHDGRQAAVGCYNNAMLLTEFSDRLCSFPDIWMEFDLAEREM